MKQVFLGQCILECLAGIVLYFNPELLFIGTEVQSMAIPIIKMFSVAIIVLGFNGIIHRNLTIDQPSFIQMYLVYMAYHLIICFSSYSFIQAHYFGHIGIPILHGVLFALMLLGYLKDR